MKSMGAKISLSVSCIAVCTFVFVQKSYVHYQKLDRLQEDINLSLYLRGYAKEIESRNVNPQTYPKETINYFRKWRNSIQEKPRVDAVSNLIQSLNTNNKALRALRFKELQEIERSFYDTAVPKIAIEKQEFQQNILIAILAPLLGLLFFTIYLFRSIVLPLQNLSKKMMDFLVDRYTFKVSDPQNNEIGDLQRTFNSLAQRAINNVDELKALDRAKSEFVSIASHELRTPLTSIKGSLGLLTSGIVGDLQSEALGLVKIAEQETDRLVRLINNLLDLAKMESRMFQLQKEWVTVQSLAESCLESLIGLAQTAQVQLEIRRPQEPIEASLDKDRVQQVVTNLISNAIKYSPKNESVVLSYFINDEKHLEIAITDRGPGIADHDQQLIFEKFRQATQPESRLVKGTGLGLAISKALIEEHGGIIKVHSRLGLGSTFSFTLPEWRLSQEQITTKSYGVAA